GPDAVQHENASTSVIRAVIWHQPRSGLWGFGDLLLWCESWVERLGGQRRVSQHRAPTAENHGRLAGSIGNHHGHDEKQTDGDALQLGGYIGEAQRVLQHSQGENGQRSTRNGSGAATNAHAAE